MPGWSGSPNFLRASALAMLASPYFAIELFSPAKSQIAQVFLVGRYAPVEDDRLGDLLPDGSGGQIAVVQGPIRCAAWIVGLAHDDQHRELWVLGGKETDVRRPDVERVLAVDGDLCRSRLSCLVQLEAFDAR